MHFKLFYRVLWAFRVHSTDYNIILFKYIHSTKGTSLQYHIILVSGDVYLLIHYSVYQQ